MQNSPVDRMVSSWYQFAQIPPLQLDRAHGHLSTRRINDYLWKTSQNKPRLIELRAELTGGWHHLLLVPVCPNSTSTA